MSRKGAVAIDALIQRIRDVPAAVLEDAAPDVAIAVRNEVARTMSQQQTPTGEPWAPRKADGAPALTGAVNALTAFAAGRVAYVRVSGVEARHHRGWVKGKVKRQMLPDKKTLTPAIIDAVVKVVVDKYTAAMAAPPSG